jgi:hypothetical protein
MPGQVLMVFDLGGMSVRANENLYPKFYPTDLESLQQLHRRHTVFHLLWDTPADRHL